MKISWIKILSVYCLFGIASDFLKVFTQSTERLMENEAAYSPGMPLWFYGYFVSVFAIVTLLSLKHFKSIYPPFSANAALACLLGYMLMSCLWALNPTQSLVAASKVVGACFFGFFLASRFTPRELLILICCTMGTITLASCFTAVLMPDYGMHNSQDHAGKWRGIFSHKNQLAIVMNISFLFFVIAARYFKRYFWGNSFFALLSLCLVLLSQSGGGVVILALVIFSPFLLPFFRLHGIMFLSVSITLACLVALLSVFVDLHQILGFVFDVLGKDPTLSGRTDTWRGILDTLSDFRSSNLLEGYGAQGVYFSSHGQVIAEQGFKFTSIDNAYMDVLVRFGLVGSFLFLLVLIKGVRVAIQQLNAGKTLLSPSYIVLMLIMLFNGLSENTGQIMLLWVFLALLLSNQLRQQTRPEPYYHTYA